MISNIQINALRSIVYKNGANFDNITAFFKHARNNFADINSPTEWSLLTAEYKALDIGSKVLFEKFETTYTNDYWQNRFADISTTIKGFFEENFEMPELFLVSELENVGQGKTWDALSLDAKDEERTGHKRGIYIKPNSINPPYFDFTVIHELIHWIISAYSSQYLPFTTLIEEGVCDFLGYYFLLSFDNANSHTVTNLISFLRAMKPAGSTWHSYYKFSKFIMNFVLLNGIDKLLGIIKQGRLAINNISIRHENLLVEPTRNINLLLLCYNSAEANLVVDPDDYSVLKTIIDNKSTNFTQVELEKSISISVNLENSLKRLQELNLLTLYLGKYHQFLLAFPANIKYKIRD